MGSISILLLPSVVFVAVFTTVLLGIRRRASNGRRPPGPPTRFLIGNLRDLPLEKEVEAFSELAEIYGEYHSYLARVDNRFLILRPGPLTYLTVLGKRILVVNTFEAASDLFEKRSANYSDRNALPMIGDLCVVLSLSFLFFLFLSFP